MKPMLIKVAPHRYGPGKVHLARNLGASNRSPYWVMSCATTKAVSHGIIERGDYEEITCKKCRPGAPQPEDICENPL